MNRSVDDLIMSARHSLTDAAIAQTAHDRYARAHLAALRAAAAVIAAQAQPDRSRKKVRSVWAVLPEMAAEFTEWAEFFAAGARKRSLAMAGGACVGHREADDLVRSAEEFLMRVCAHIGIGYQAPLISGLRCAS